MAKPSTVGIAPRGSRLHLQQYVHAHQERFAEALQQHASLAAFLTGKPSWVSPLASEDFLEYRDRFWGKLELPPPTPQAAKWWPNGGPQWDGLATLLGHDESGVLLVEAKANLREITGSGTSATDASRKIITAALAETAGDLGSGLTDAWTGTYYQTANRLAYLRYLRSRHKAAWLAFVYFTGAGEPPSAPTQAQWEPAIQTGWDALGVDPSARHVLQPYILKVFLEAPTTPTRAELARAVPRAKASAVTRAARDAGEATGG